MKLLLKQIYGLIILTLQGYKILDFRFRDRIIVGTKKLKNNKKDVKIISLYKGVGHD